MRYLVSFSTFYTCYENQNNKIKGIIFLVYNENIRVKLVILKLIILIKILHRDDDE